MLHYLMPFLLPSSSLLVEFSFTYPFDLKSAHSVSSSSTITKFLQMLLLNFNLFNILLRAFQSQLVASYLSSFRQQPFLASSPLFEHLLVTTYPFTLLYFRRQIGTEH